MDARRMNRVSGVVLIVLSLTALVTVLVGLSQVTEPLPRDEGTGAHIFQLAIVALLPIGVLLLATADWNRPWRSARPLVVSCVATLLAFGALYYLEHIR